MAPVVVSMTAGMPVEIPAKLLLPPVTLVTSRSKWCAVGRRNAAPNFVAAKLRIIRWNALVSSKDRSGMVSLLPKLNAGGKALSRARPALQFGFRSAGS